MNAPPSDSTGDPRFSAIVLAADRRRDDPLLAHNGVCAKGLIDLGGTRMIERVITALEHSEQVGDILLAGPPRECLQTCDSLHARIEAGRVRWQAPAGSPASSAWQAMHSLPPQRPVLVTTADHPLLRAEIIDHFLAAARASGAELAAAVTTIAAVQARFPGAHKTVMKFSDAGYCGCNLFAFMSPASRRVASVWRQVEQQRKNPLYLIRQLGILSVLRYSLGRLDIDTAAARLSRKLGVHICPLRLPFAEAAIDVDTVEDQAFVRAILAGEK